MVSLIHESIEGAIITIVELNLQASEGLISSNAHMEIVLIHGNVIECKSVVHEEEFIGQLAVIVKQLLTPSNIS